MASRGGGFSGEPRLVRALRDLNVFVYPNTALPPPASSRRCMALSATVYVFTVRLADADRGVYETLNLRVAQHPSESPEYLITRVLGFCLEYTEGIAFSKGRSEEHTS